MPILPGSIRSKNVWANWRGVKAMLDYFQADHERERSILTSKVVISITNRHTQMWIGLMMGNSDTAFREVDASNRKSQRT